MAEPVNAPVRTDEPRGADLQAQIEGLRQALQDWRRTREYSQPTLERLAQITVQCAGMVDSWQQVEQHRALPAAGEPAGADASAGPHGEPDPGEHIRALERTIEQEWRALRDDQNNADAYTGLQPAGGAAADLTLRGLARTESRLAALEQDLKGSIAQLSRDLQAVVAELRSTRPQPASTPPAAFPLESVMRIHEEMRASEGGGAAALPAGGARALPEWTESATALKTRMDSLERAVDSAAHAPAARGWRPLYAALVVIVLLAALGAMALAGLSMQRRVDARLNDASVRVAAAEQQRDAANAATREQAAREVAAARQSAAQAQIVGNVLAAPDLVRYWLTGSDANARAYAQVLFSRSRGMVFSASRLPAAGDGKTYQLWLLTKTGAVSGGLFAPDAAGRVTLSTDVPPALSGRLSGALVTREATGGGTQPSAENVLTRIE
jgi:hypothetical protein